MKDKCPTEAVSGRRSVKHEDFVDNLVVSQINFKEKSNMRNLLSRRDEQVASKGLMSPVTKDKIFHFHIDAFED